jgi:hypothetical protein
VIDKQKLRRVSRNPGWYAGTAIARLKQRLTPTTEIEPSSAFLFAQEILASGCLQPVPLATAHGVSDERKLRDSHETLSDLLDRTGSDKGTRHGYAEVYQRWADSNPHPVSVVVEIGLGSPSALTPSNMGPEARPGASAIAFADYFRGSHIVGVDIDPRAFPTGVHGTFFVADQLRPPSFGPVLRELAEFGGFDFAVVDGLHLPEADINSLLLLLPWLRPKGLLCIEDIGSDPATVASWRELVIALRDPYKGQVSQCNLSHLVTITRD